MFSRFIRSILGRLYTTTVVLALAFSGVAWYSYVQLTRVSHLVVEIRDVNISQLARIAGVELNVTRVSLQLRHAMLARNVQERDASLNDIAEKRRLLEEALKSYEKAISTPDERQLFDKFPPLLAEFWRHGEANIALIRRRDGLLGRQDHSRSQRRAATDR